MNDTMLLVWLLLANLEFTRHRYSDQNIALRIGRTLRVEFIALTMHPKLGLGPRYYRH